MPVAESHNPSAPPTSVRDANEVELLLAFVRDRNVHCPRCDYNLRNLTQPVCPECREELALSVGARRPTFVWLIVAMAPGIFSGIAAFILLSAVTIAFIAQGFQVGGSIPWQPVVLDGFGWCSAIGMIVLFLRRHWFLKQSKGRQILIAASMWLIHVGFFFLFIFLNM